MIRVLIESDDKEINKSFEPFGLKYNEVKEIEAPLLIDIIRKIEMHIMMNYDKDRDVFIIGHPYDL